MTKKYVTELQGICVIEIYNKTNLNKPVEKHYVYLNETGLFSAIYKVNTFNKTETFKGYLQIAKSLDVFLLDKFFDKCKKKHGDNIEFKIKQYDEDDIFNDDYDFWQ